MVEDFINFLDFVCKTLSKCALYHDKEHRVYVRGLVNGITRHFGVEFDIEKALSTRAWAEIKMAYACMGLQSSCVDAVGRDGVRDNWVVQPAGSLKGRPWTTSVVHEANGHVCFVYLSRTF